MNLFQLLSWRIKYAHGSKRFDPETNRWLYRRAPYCLNCHKPVMAFGSLCDECKTSPYTF